MNLQPKTRKRELHKLRDSTGTTEKKKNVNCLQISVGCILKVFWLSEQLFHKNPKARKKEVNSYVAGM